MDDGRPGRSFPRRPGRRCRGRTARRRDQPPCPAAADVLRWRRAGDRVRQGRRPRARRSRCATSGLYHEPRLFSSGVVLPLDHPTVYTAIIDEDRRDFLMIMEDVVARGAEPRDSTRPMTVDQVANGVRGLARMHSAILGRAPDERPRTRMGRALRRLRRARVRPVAHRPRAIGRHRGRRDPVRSPEPSCSSTSGPATSEH